MQSLTRPLSRIQNAPRSILSITQKPESVKDTHDNYAVCLDFQVFSRENNRRL